MRQKNGFRSLASLMINKAIILGDNKIVQVYQALK